MACEYCNERPEAIEVNLSKRFKYAVILGGKLCFANDYTVITHGVDINYCPMCGSKLSDTDD